MKNNRQNGKFRPAPKAKNIGCSCGSTSKLHINKNYPFGRNSKVVISEFYKCSSCGKVTFVNKDLATGRNGSR